MNPQPKLKRIKCQPYLNWLKTQKNCTFDYGTGDIVPAHQTVRISSSVKGTGQKEHDIFALPLYDSLHKLEHGGQYKIENKVDKIINHIFKYLIQKKNYEFASKISEKTVDAVISQVTDAKQVLEWITINWNKLYKEE
jgi:hypothetical protein